MKLGTPILPLSLFPKQLPAPEKESDDWDDFGDLEDIKPLELKTPEKPAKYHDTFPLVNEIGQN